MDHPRWIFLRHGECEGNVEGVLVAPDASPLTLLGRRQAEEAARRLAAFPVERVLCSPMLRAQQTAAIVQPVLGLGPAQVVEALRERSFGPLDGWTRAQVRQSEWADCRLAWRKAPPGGESLEAVARRAGGALAALDTGETTLVVAHAGVIRALVGWMDGLPVEDIGRMRVPHGRLLHRLVRSGAWDRIGRRTDLLPSHGDVV